MHVLGRLLLGLGLLRAHLRSHVRVCFLGGVLEDRAMQGKMTVRRLCSMHGRCSMSNWSFPGRKISCIQYRVNCGDLQLVSTVESDVENPVWQERGL